MSTLSYFPLFQSRYFRKMSSDNNNIVVTTSSYLDFTNTSSPSPTGPDTARRCLFGAANSEDNKKFVKRELDAISKADEKTWNFNFTAGIPLVGRFQWETIDKDIPAPFKEVNLVKEEPLVEKIDIPEKAHTSKMIIKKKIPESNSHSSGRRRSLKIRDNSELAKAKRNLIFNHDNADPTKIHQALEVTTKIHQEKEESAKIQSEHEISTSSNSSNNLSDSESSAEESSSNVNNNNSAESSPSPDSIKEILTDILPITKRSLDEISESSDKCCSKRQKLESHSRDPAE